MMTPYRRVLTGREYIALSFYYGGPVTALNAVEGVSHDIAPLVAHGEIMSHCAWDALQEVSHNIGLVSTFGQDRVQAAIASGPRAYEEFCASFDHMMGVGSVAA